MRPRLARPRHCVRRSCLTLRGCSSNLRLKLAQPACRRCVALALVGPREPIWALPPLGRLCLCRRKSTRSADHSPRRLRSVAVALCRHGLAASRTACSTSVSGRTSRLPVAPMPATTVGKAGRLEVVLPASAAVHAGRRVHQCLWARWVPRMRAHRHQALLRRRRRRIAASLLLRRRLLQQPRTMQSGERLQRSRELRTASPLRLWCHRLRRQRYRLAAQRVFRSVSVRPYELALHRSSSSPFPVDSVAMQASPLPHLPLQLCSQLTLSVHHPRPLPRLA